MPYYARFAGLCTMCLKPIVVGQAITWARTKGPKNVYHLDCHNLDRKYEAEKKEEPLPTLPNEVIIRKIKLEEFRDQEQAERDNKLQSLALKRLTEGVPMEDKVIPTATQEQPDIIPATIVTPKADRQDTVQQALSMLMSALQPKAEAPSIDVNTIKAIVREVVTNEGVVKYEFVRKDLPPITIDLAHKKLPQLVDYVTHGEHAYLFGPHGSGKSTGAMQAAEILGRKYGYISLTPQTPESRLIGYMNATGTYVRTQFRDIYEHGGVFCVDEMDNGSPSLLTTLNGALENGHMAFPDTTIQRHADFVLVGTGNTSGRGANLSYPERRPFDAAFADRFQYIEWDYDEKLEKKITKAMNPDSLEWTIWVQQVRKWAEKNHPRFIPSPRASFRIAKGLSVKRDINSLLDSALWRGDSELRTKVIANCPMPGGEL